ncbi:MAG: DUF1697 domain-containing protein [Gemmatimonadaceae bacterium]|nr:DUF1697 domain-containing protein [Gemmatimonadaceae bacterium]
MARYAAFLRAINVGKRRVTMDALRRIVEGIGGSDVRTVLASGNVVFSSRHRTSAAARRALEGALADSLGFAVPSTLRTFDELRAVVAAPPFDVREQREAFSLLIGFADAAIPAAAVRVLEGLSCRTDLVRVLDRHIWWLRREQQSAAELENGHFDRAAGVPLTFRTVATVTKVLAQD